MKKSAAIVALLSNNSLVPESGYTLNFFELFKMDSFVCPDYHICGVSRLKIRMNCGSNNNSEMDWLRGVLS